MVSTGWLQSRFKFALQAAACALCLVFLSEANSAYAFEKDTHFGLTYFLARSVGFPQEAAFKIANADWSVDLNPETQPLTLDTDILESFHAFKRTPDPVTVDDTARSKVGLADRLLEEDGIVKRNFEAAWQRGLDLRNPGIALHFLQDIYAHAGYASSTDWLAPGHSVPDIHAVDFLSNNKWTAHKMMMRTRERLELFMRHLQQQVCPAETDRLEYALARLIEASSVDVLISRDRNPGQVLPVRSASPDFRKAAEVLSRLLPSEAHILQRGGLESGDDRGSSFRINPDGSIPRRPDGPRGQGLFAEEIGVVISPVDYLTGERWKDPTQSDPVKRHLHFPFNTADENKDNVNAVDFWGSHDWKFVGYEEASREWHFSRTPELNEMPKEAPPTFGSKDPEDWEWAKQQVQGKLKLHLVLRRDECKLRGKFYRGLMNFSKDTATGERKAWIPDAKGSEAWGPVTEVTYERDWPDVPR